MASEREQIAKYLGEQLHELYLRDELYFVAGVAWSVGRILGEAADERILEPEPTESLDEFLRRESDGGDGVSGL